MQNIIGLKSNVFLAPMAGITDYPFRKLVASKGKANLYTEMVAVNAINRKNPKTYRIADVRNEPYPVIVQLVGNDPELFFDAAKLVMDLGAYSIDINIETDLDLDSEHITDAQAKYLSNLINNKTVFDFMDKGVARILIAYLKHLRGIKGNENIKITLTWKTLNNDKAPFKKYKT